MPKSVRRSSTARLQYQGSTTLYVGLIRFCPPATPCAILTNAGTASCRRSMPGGGAHYTTADHVTSQQRCCLVSNMLNHIGVLVLPCSCSEGVVYLVHTHTALVLTRVVFGVSVWYSPRSRSPPVARPLAHGRCGSPPGPGRSWPPRGEAAQAMGQFSSTGRLPF